MSRFRMKFTIARLDEHEFEAPLFG